MKRREEKEKRTPQVGKELEAQTVCVLKEEKYRKLQQGNKVPAICSGRTD